MAVLAAAIAACSLAPSYKAPETAASDGYKESAGTADASAANAPVNVGTWTAAQPADSATRGAWWTAFGDPLLNDLENRAFAANQNLAAAVARYRQARDAADIAGTSLFPIIGLTASGVRERISKYAPTNTTGAAKVGGDYVLRAQTSYELDFWGRVRNTIAAARSRAQASAADLETAQLSIQAELAGDYFELCGLDAQIDLLSATVNAYREALRITQNRYDGGVAAIVDVDQATTQLETAQVQLADTRLSRMQLEHAIAILTGVPPSTFTLEPTPLRLQPPAIVAGLPSQLLQRRPDVASAERQVFAANAEIGVTRAAWFPTFSLDGNIGFESGSTGNWIEAPARMWSLGPSAALTLFDWGLRHAQNDQAIAAFDETVANYRQTVLTAYGEVEDQLAAIRWLDVQLAAQDRAVASSQNSLDQSNYRYKGGIVTYLEVVTAQNAALQAQQAALNLRVRRLNAALQLIKAVGGDWSAAQLDQPTAAAAKSGADNTVVKGK
ncbi:MAG: efflux system, outer rane lipoprotein NodT family [Nevskia sp.]|nr:efflux system, outer rane lipoprotein NodT family [Nevskia sp.]